jgi:hypothetical protein
MQSQSILLLSANPTVSRFLAKVIIPQNPEDCWGWKLCKDKKGYALFSIKTKSIKAHRLSYQLFNGEIPAGMCVCHSCDNPSCTNPRHLWLGTNADNLRDMIAKGRANKAKGESNGTHTRRDRVPRGDRHWNTKIPDAEIPDVFRLRSHGMSYEELAQIFQVTPGLIGHVLKGRSRQAAAKMKKSL